MANRQFNVSIILDIVTKGLEEISALFSGLKPDIDKTTNAVKAQNKALENQIDTVDKLLARQRELAKIPRNTRTDPQIEELKNITGIISRGLDRPEKKVIEEIKALYGGVFESAADASKKAATKISSNINDIQAQLREIKIGGLESLDRIQEVFKRIKEGADVKLDIDSATAIEETKVLERVLRDLLNQAQGAGDLEVFKNLSNVLASIKAARTELENLIKQKERLDAKPADIRVKLAQDFPKVKAQVKELIDNFEKSKELGQSVGFRKTGGAGGTTANTEINATLKLLGNLRKQMKQIGEDPIKIDVEIQRLLALKEELKSVGVAKDRVARQEIAVKVGNLNQLKELDTQARRLLIDLEAAKKAGNLKLVAELDIKRADLQNKLDQIRKPIDDLNNRAKIEGFEGVASKLDGAKRAVAGFGQAAADQAQRIQVDNAKTSESISNIVTQARRLATEVQKAAKEGVSVDLRPDFKVRGTELQDAINKVESSGTLSGKQLEALTKAKAVVENTVDDVNQLTRANVASGEAAKQNVAALAAQFDNLKGKFRDIRKELKDAQELGNATTIKPKIELDTNNVIADLKKAIEDAQKTGQNADPLRKQLALVEKFQQSLVNVNQQADNLAKRKITIKGQIDADFKDINRRLAEVNKELDAAIKKGDTRVVLKIQANIDDLKKDLAKIQPLIDQVKTKAEAKRLTSTQLGVDTAQDRLNAFNKPVSNAVTGSIKSLGNAFRLAAQDAGGMRAATTGLASVLRLAGTSALLVGGQFRTLGFGLTAFSSIIQNIAPIVTSFAGGLVKAGPPGLILLGILSSLGAILTVTAAKLVLVAGALGALIETGFEYNSALEQTRNASAALAQEFFDFSVGGEKVNETFEIGGKVLSKYQIAQLAVEQQFQGLQTAALTTIFTNRELLGTFQNIILASKGLSPSLEAVTGLTGQFARVAGLIGISAEKLASQVNLVLSGTGRVTSPLQRFLNAAKDSKGIELTAKRIRELRAMGGEVLFNELTTAISKFDEALKVANRSSFAGVISNFQDLFEQIAQLSTKSVFDGLRDGLGRTIDRLTQKVKRLKDDGTVETNLAGEAVEDVRPAKALLDIAKTAEKIFGVIQRDLIRLVNFLIDNLGKAAGVLEDNYQNIIAIYESVKDIVKALGQAVLAFSRLLTLSSDTNSQLKSTVSILDTIVVITNTFRSAIDLVSLGVNGLLALLFRIPLLLGESLLKASQLSDFLFNANQESGFTKAVRERTEAIEDFIAARKEAAFAAGADNADSAREIGDIVGGKRSKEREAKIIEGAKADQTNRILQGFQERRDQVRTDSKNKKLSPEKASEKINQILDEENSFRQKVSEDINLRKAGKQGLDFSTFEKKEKIKSIGTGKGTSEEDKKGRQKAQKSELADTKAFIDEIRKLGAQREQNELKLVQDRLKQEQDLSQAALDNNLISQQEHARKVASLRNQEITNEITTRKNALALLNAERLDKEKAFQEEERAIRENAARTKESPAVTSSKLDVLNLKESTELVSNRREQVRIEGEINALAQDRNAIAITYLSTLQSISRESRIQTEDLQRSIVDLKDLNDEETLRFRLNDAVQQKAEDILKINKEIAGIQGLLKTATDPNEVAILQKTLEERTKTKNLMTQELSIRQRLIVVQSAQNLASELQGKLAASEAERSLEVARGLKSERQATIEATAERIKYKNALLELLEAQEEALAAPVFGEEDKIANQARREQITRLKQEIQGLKTVIDEKDLNDSANSIRDNFVTLFDDLQSGAKGAAQSFADLGKSILATFRNLISKRLTEELFSGLFPTQGQTEGKATGIFAKIFSSIGLGTGAEDQRKAEERARNPKFGAAVTPEQQRLIDLIKEQSTAGSKGLLDSIEILTKKIEDETIPFEAAIKGLRLALEKAGFVVSERSPDSAKDEAQRVIEAGKGVGNKSATQKALGLPVTADVPVSINNVAVEGTEKGKLPTKEVTPTTDKLSKAPKTPVSIAGENIPQDTSGVFNAITDGLRASSDKVVSAIGNFVEKLSFEIRNAASGVKPVSIQDSGAILPTLTQYFNSLQNTVALSIGAKLDQIITLLNTTGSVSSSESPLSVFGELGDEGFASGGGVGFLSRGAVKGKGGIKSDSVPARLSNGEYVLQAPVVSKIGTKVLDFMNATGAIPEAALAGGGSLLKNAFRPDYVAPKIDTTKFNYLGGGAKLINKPAPIVEPEPPKPKKVGGLRKLFGGILSFAAPFLNLIPGIGPFLSLGAGALGGVLSGNNAKESILGGILGGLGNLGGFAKAGGGFGKFASFFSSGQGKSLTGILGAGSGNSGNQAGFGGQTLLALLQRLGLFKNKKANGGIIGLAGGGLLGGLSGLFGKLGASGGSGGIGQLLALFGLSSALGKLSGAGQQQEEFAEVVVEDPDAERKNKLGSAYNQLVDEGSVAAYKYREDTLAKLLRQQEGFKNLVRLPKKGGLLQGLLGLLPFLSGVLGGGGKLGASKSLVDAPSGFGNQLGDVFASTGGFISALAGGGKVKGAGTSTSDSIPALLSNGEYVIKASSVRAMGTNILDSINSGKMLFSKEGGAVGVGVSTLPDSNPVSNPPPVRVDGSVQIANFIDPSLFDSFLNTAAGKKKIVNVISASKKAVKATLA